MSESQLSETQRKRIEQIKKEWQNEICSLFDKWDKEDKELRKKYPDAPVVLDRHLKQQAEIEKKYRDRIQAIVNENE